MRTLCSLETCSWNEEILPIMMQTSLAIFHSLSYSPAPLSQCAQVVQFLLACLTHHRLPLLSHDLSVNQSALSTQPTCVQPRGHSFIHASRNAQHESFKMLTSTRTTSSRRRKNAHCKPLHFFRSSVDLFLDLSFETTDVGSLS